MIKVLVFGLVCLSIYISLALIVVNTISADESGFDYQVYDQHIIKTNILLDSNFNNITYSQDSNECFVWVYSETENHWHILSVDNPQVFSDYITDGDDGRHLIRGCFGPTTTPVWLVSYLTLDTR